MEWDDIRPILSGLAGGAITTWLSARWARSAPQSFGGTSVEVLQARHRVARWVANTLFFAGLGLALVMYGYGGYAETDAFPLALGWGLACTMPVVGVAIVSLAGGRSVPEAWFAWMAEDNAPVPVIIGILASGVAALFYALATLIF